MRINKILFAIVAIQLISCATVPITGRKQVNMIPESQLIGMSVTAYADFLKESPALPVSNKDAKMVKDIGENISKAVEKFMTENGMAKKLEGYKWEFNLVNDNAVNAWCMSGGKVVVYTGLLAVTQNEDALACVMGHEVAHAIARHGNERMSQGLVVQAGGMALNVALSQKSELTQNLFAQSFGMGSQLGILKFSRLHESEADKLGLVFMAMAGYDPRAAIDFWQRMSEGGGKKPPEIVSTHPSDERRIADIKAYMPEALKYYKK